MPLSRGLMNGNTTHNARQYDKSEWRAKEVLIKGYYIDENMTLPEVMTIMSKVHNFHATRKMYVSRLEGWGLHKNLTENRVRNLVGQEGRRDATRRPSKLRREGRIPDAQRVEKYLKRTKRFVRNLISTKEAIEMTGIENFSGASAPDGLSRSDACSNQAYSKDSAFIETPKDHGYDSNCPYRSGLKRFRITEKFSDGSIYEADSLGTRSYLASDEDRPCTEFCYCRQHVLSRDFSFLVQKTLDKIDITIYSDGLYAYVVAFPGLEDLKEDSMDQERTVNGLVLLKHYHELKNRLDIFRTEGLHSSTIHTLASELELLVEGLLGDAEVFKSFGYENLYERGFIEFELWKKFQQDCFERDVSNLNQGFYDIDDEELEESLPEESLPPMSQSVTEQVIFDEDEELTTPLGSRSPFSGDCSAELTPSEIQRLKGYVLRDCASAYAAGRKSTTTPAVVMTSRSDAVLVVTTTTNASSTVVAPSTPYRIQSTPSRYFCFHDACDAVQRNDVEWLRSYLNYATDKNCSPPYSLLQIAAAAGHEGVVRLLLDRGALVNGDNSWFASPLEVAAKAGHKEIVRLLLDRGALMNRDDSRFASLLEVAVEAGYEGVVRLLLDHGVSPHKLRERSLDYAMVAHAYIGKISAVRTFLNCGVEINAVTDLGTALSAAASKERSYTMRWLLRHGAEVDTAVSILQSSNGTRDKVAGLLKVVALERSKQQLRRGESLSSHAGRRQNFRNLRRSFVDQHVSMIDKARASSTRFCELVHTFPHYRDTWGAGIETMRGLGRGQRPTVANTIAFLCLAKATSETLNSTGGYDYTEPFFRDLTRWQLIFTDEEDRCAYRDAIHSMWWWIAFDEIPSSEGLEDEDLLNCFSDLASILASQADETFGMHGLNETGFGSNQEAWRQRNSSLFSSTDAGKDDSEPPDPGQDSPPASEIQLPQPPDPDPDPHPPSLMEGIEGDRTVVDHVVISLMLGAIFAMTLILLQWLRNICSGYSGILPLAVSITTLQDRHWNLQMYLGAKPIDTISQACLVFLRAEGEGQEQAEGFDSFF